MRAFAYTGAAGARWHKSFEKKCDADAYHVQRKNQ